MNRPGGPSKIIIVKKKVKKHGGHHGGSWKVAYADFVTAMMAFFLVMWIMGMDQGVKDMVQGYFQNPVGFKRSFSGGRNILSQGNSIVNVEVRRAVMLRRRDEEAGMRAAADSIEARLARIGVLEEAIDVQAAVTSEGLRIEMMETSADPVFFQRGSARLTPALDAVLHLVAAELRGLPEMVVVEGHTDAVPFGRADYTNWELSVERANAARRVLLAGGLQDARIAEVRGYADRRPRIGDDPSDPRNRRISILLPFLGGDPDIIELGAAQGGAHTPAPAPGTRGDGDQ